jgi:TRAP transporter TAXI family solute receptor
MSVSHPNGVVAAAAERCGAALIPIQGPAVDVLLATWPFYAPAVIPAGLYSGNTLPVPTFGLRATLVTSLRAPDDTVYRLVRALFEGLYEFRDQHPALATLQPQEMISQANSLTLHNGALRYFQETGLK